MIRRLCYMPPEPPSKNNVCAVVVTYHPDDGFPQRLAAVSSQVDRVLIVDNNSGPETLSHLKLLSEDSNIELIANDDNLGVGAALNQGVDWARARGYAWLLTLDQDTLIVDGVIDTFAEVYESCAGGRDIALIGSNYIDKLTRASFVLVEAPDGRPCIDVLTVITSGTLVSIATAREIGPFREEFFIDDIDYEYCLRAKQKGYGVVITRRPLMEHTVGVPRYHKFLGKRLITPHLPAHRRYYMSRNQTVLTREYRRAEPAWIKWMTRVRIKELILVLLFEKDKLNKMCKTIRGVYDGLTGRMGRL